MSVRILLVEQLNETDLEVTVIRPCFNNKVKAKMIFENAPTAWHFLQCFYKKEPIQKRFPNFNSTEREFLISGLTKEEQDVVFKNEEV